MKKQRLQRLKTLLSVNQRLEDLARIDYLKAHKHWLDEVEKSEQLKRFKAEYNQQLQQIGSQGAQAAKLRELALFIGQLDASIDKQQLTIENFFRHQQEKSLEYIRAKSKTESLQKVLDQLVKEVQVEQDKMSQKENDEYAQNIWYSSDKNRL